jgi:Flp pilus assembly protein TadB
VSADVGLSLLAGAVVGLGLLVLLVALSGWSLRGPDRAVAYHQRERLRVSLRSRGVIGLLAGPAVWYLTGWPVAGLAVGLLAAFWDRVAGGGAEERLGILRLEALATWTESLRDTIAGAVGLEQAIPATAATAAPIIRPSLNLLVDRLRIREPLGNALMALAGDLGDPSADVVCSALVLNSRLRGPGLRDVLSALAVSIREELDLRRRIEAGRRSVRRSVRIVLAIVLGVMGLLSVFNHSFVQPYDGLVGQLMLVFIAFLFLLGLLWMRRLAAPAKVERFLVTTPARSPAGGQA